jgi:hypothetical protein
LRCDFCRLQQVQLGITVKMPNSVTGLLAAPAQLGHGGAVNLPRTGRLRRVARGARHECASASREIERLLKAHGIDFRLSSRDERLALDLI